MPSPPAKPRRDPLTASLDDGIDTRAAFDAEVRALASRALRSGGYLPLVTAPIATVEQITDELLDLVASGSPRRAKGGPTFLAEAWVRRRSGQARRGRRRAAEPKLDESELEDRRRGLKVTLTKLVRAGVDVTAVVNVPDAARGRYLELVVRRGQKPMAAKLKRLKANADRALRDLIQYFRAADQMVRKVRGPGTLDEYVGGETEQIYAESEPALTFMAAHDMLSRHGRLNPSFLRRSKPPTNNPPHQQLIDDVKRQLDRLGVGTDDAANLIRYTGLLALMRLDR